MIPIDGEPTHMVKLVEDYGAWLAQNDLPKLFIMLTQARFLSVASENFAALGEIKPK